MTRLFSIGGSVRWQTRRFDAERAAIRDELSTIAASDSGTQQALSHAIQQVEILSADDGPVAQMRRLIYVIGGLTLHAQFGGLRPQQLGRLFNLAYAILKTENIHSGTSRLAFLHGELHDLKARLHAGDGQHWLAAWEQQLASYAAGNEAPDDPGYQLVMSAERALRLGHGALAMRACESVEALGDKWLASARLLRLRLLRLSGNAVGAEALALDSRTLPWSESQLRELAWEAACRTVACEHDLESMTRLAATGASHHAPRFVLEHQLWARAFPLRRWEEKLANVAYLQRKKGFKGQSAPRLIEAAAVLESLYDYTIPVEVRLDKLGPLLNRATELPSTEATLLVWAAAARWLARGHFFPMAALVLGQYHVLSLMLSSGTNGDALGIAADLLARDWYTGLVTEDTATTSLTFQIAE